ncbi:MAG: 2-phosphosulfolactate phosphatase [Deltaproteobacteria bacterium]|jgi:2-phosphosulfolactate phosphatase
MVKTVTKRFLNGAETAAGIVVIIDVFRSSNTILMFLARGASSVIPVMTIEDALKLKQKHPDYILAGEREGIKVRGFDMGNSPYEASRMELDGKRVILTTSGGTQVIRRTTQAQQIVIGSFGNAQALINMLTMIDPPLVTWLSVGTGAVSDAVEDDLCALYLQGTLKRSPQDFETIRSKILKGDGANRLRRLKQENDFFYCLGVDIFDFVPILADQGDVMGFVKQWKV